MIITQVRTYLMDMSKYKGMFISETKEHLQTMNQLIVSLEKDSSNQENIEALFRVAHSVKGMAASMGYHDVSALSHNLEDMMDLFRKGELTLSSGAFDILFEGLDALEFMIKGIEDDQPAECDISSIISKIATLKGGGATSPEETETASTPPKKKVTSPAEPLAGQDVTVVDIEIEKSAPVPAMRGFILYKKIEEFGKIIATEPDIEEVKKGNFNRKIIFQVSDIDDIEALRQAMTSMVELADFRIKSLQERAEDKKEEVAEEEPPPPDIVKTKKTSKKSTQIRTVRVTTNLLDNLINIVGEMIIARSRLFEIGKEIDSPPLKSGLLEMSNHIRDLHDQVMTVRMTPIDNLMERLPRVVRDLARKSDKKIDLKVEGKDIELDRAIVEEMGDPLVHILRNCVDHGIETVEEREQAGKDPEGKIVIRAMREKDQVIINISDDGRGMDIEKIKKKAIERKLITEEKALSMHDRDALMLICHSGLSTADKVTDVSGRGVGMDAVKNIIDFIGGSLDISSKLGKGSNIVIKLPLTVAIIQVLLVKLADIISAIPINKIIRTMEVEKSALKRTQKQLAVLIDDELVPLLSLRKILGMGEAKEKAHLISIVVVEMRNRKVGLVVDSLIGQQEAFIKPLESPLEWIKGFSGATILGDGSVIFVLDIPNLLK